MRPSTALSMSHLLGVLLLLACMGSTRAEPTAPAATSPAPLTQAQLRTRLRSIGALKHPPERYHDQTLYPRLELEDPSLVILRAARERPELEHVLAALGKQYGLNPAAARDLLGAQVLVLFPPQGDELDATPEETRTALALYVNAARQAPGSRVMLAATLDLHSAYLLPREEFEARILEMVDSASDPVAQALAFSRLQGQSRPWGLSFAALAASRDPKSLPHALEAIGLQASGREATLFYLAAYQALRARPGEPFPSALAERLLRNLLREGLPSRAVEVLRQLPAAQREDLLTGGSALSDAPQDPRLDVAGALFFVGEVQEARRWRDAVPPTKPSAPNDPHAPETCELERKRAALAAHLEPEPGGDPFPLLLVLNRCRRDIDHPWTLLLDTALQATYPQSAREDLHLQVEHERQEKKNPPPLRAQLSFLDEAQRLLESEDQEQLARLQAALAAVPTPTASASSVEADPVAPRIREWLEAPSTSPFSEHPLAEAPRLKPATRWTPPQKGSLPRGFHPVRAERSGKHVLLLALSQRLDPTGEVSSGGYWLLESQDEGHTWGTPLYTGLREYRPYELAEKSSLPMLEGDTLRLEASVRELDEQLITFPPTSLATKREKKGLFLEAHLSALRQDSDGDGLTDLIEARLLTDPRSADTDADGIPDGEDPLPQVPAAPQREAEPMAQVLSALIAELHGGAELPPGLEVGLPPEGTPPHELRLPKGPLPESQDKVMFLEMERGALRGAWMHSRTLVLTPEELRRAQERLGAFYPLRVHIQLNVKGDQALIEWDEHWRGGGYLAHREQGRWVFESQGEWIT